MKRISVLLHVLFMSFFLAGCGDNGGGGKHLTEHVTITGLGVEESQVGVDHPLHIKLTVVSQAAIDEVDVAVGLMQKVSPDATDAEKQAAHSCMLGLATIQNLQADTPASSIQEFVVHEDCLGADGSAMDYNVFVVLNPYNEVVETGEGQDENNSIVYNISESWRPENAACISEGADEPGCVFNVRIVPNPGLNLQLSQIELESPTLVLLSSSDSPDVTVVTNEHDEPALEADAIVRAYGVPAHSLTTLPAGTQINYSICPADDDCRSQHWLPLTIYSNPHEPDGHKTSETIDAAFGQTRISFSHALYAEGATLAALSPGGRWATSNDFLVRACLTTSGDTDIANNCKTAAAARQGAGNNAIRAQRKAQSSLNFTKSNDNEWGANTAHHVTSSFSISDTVNQTGAHIVSVYNSEVDGLQLGRFEGSAEARGGYGAETSGLAFKVSSFGNSVYSYAKTGTKIYYPVRDWWRVARQYCLSNTLNVYILKISASHCLTGQIGFKGLMSNEIQDYKPQVSEKYLNVSYVMEKAVDFDGSASGSSNFEVTRAGLSGSYAVLHENYKSTAAADWTLYEAGRMSSMIGGANTRTIWNCTSLSGSIKAYADAAVPDLCPKPPFVCRSWKRVYDNTIEQWQGETRSDVTLIDRTAANVLIMSPW